MYLILQGKMSLNAQKEVGRENLTIELGQGDVFGEIGITGPSARTSTVRAVDNSVLLHITEHTLNDLEQGAPKIAFTLYLNLVAIVEAPFVRGRSTNSAVKSR